MILDEAANYPLPSLPSLMSEGGGTGITTMVVLQSLAGDSSEDGSPGTLSEPGRGARTSIGACRSGGLRS